jgi:integrase
LSLISEFRKFVNHSQSGRRRTATGKRISGGCLEQYRRVLTLLTVFDEQLNYPLRIRLLHRASLREMLKEKRYWEVFFLDFCNFLYRKRNYFDQSACSVFKMIKTFFNYLLVEKGLPIGQFYKKFRIPAEKFTPVVLTPAQLNFLITNKEFENSLSPLLKRTKDIFVFGCTVGLRYSDLMRLKKSNIYSDGETTVLQLTTNKTGSEVKSPLPDYAMEIIGRYKRITGTRLLPGIANSNFNINIKSLMEKTGWVQPMPRMRHRQGKLIEVKTKKGKSFRFCDQITAHTMRRTAITILLMLGVPEMVVRKISGHAPGSKEFFRYVSIAQDFLDDKVREAHNKLIELS